MTSSSQTSDNHLSEFATLLEDIDAFTKACADNPNHIHSMCATLGTQYNEAIGNVRDHEVTLALLQRSLSDAQTSNSRLQIQLD